MVVSDKVKVVAKRLQERYPETHTFLNYETDWQLLFATMLSAQSTDKSVNTATSRLFIEYPRLEDYREENRKGILDCIRFVGLSNSKTGYLIKTAQILLKEYGGVIPKDRKKLVLMPGVGFKTASVVLAELYDFPFIPVDTHVHRVAIRLGFVKDKTSPNKTEEKLEKLFKDYHSIHIHRQLILFGRNTCHALNPECEDCPFKDFCTYKKKAK